MEKLTDESCVQFAQALASKCSVPGGGGAAALVGALGTALCSMAVNFTMGKKKYAAVEKDIERVLVRAETLRTRLLDLVDEDAAAFAPLSKAYTLPRSDPNRDEVLEAAAIGACSAPLQMVKCCAEAIDLLREMLNKSSTMLLSDVGCGALLCKAAMEAAAMNVFVNTGTIREREEARTMETEVDTLLRQYLPVADQITVAVTERIRGGKQHG